MKAKAAKPTETLQITECPTCGSDKIRRTRKAIKRTYKDHTYCVPDVSFWECPDCSERIFDRTAMRQIEAASPAYAKPRRAAG
jgi:YgiT-type zinc finger domain-containing protein